MTNTEQKAKAKELIESFYRYMPFKDVKLTSCDERPELIIQMEKLSAKQCAIIAIDEILDTAMTGYLVNDKAVAEFQIKMRNYWKQVKTEIEALP